MQKTILLLGSGELGKEFAIAMGRLGQRVIAVDSYDGAPAQQVTPYREVIDMLDGDALDRLVEKHRPDLIVPEIEAIRTERFYDYEAQGIQVVPSARAANFTMNRRAIRDLAAVELGLRTAPYRYATSLEELEKAADEVGIPCVVKPLMSSSGKGQSTVRSREDLTKAWDAAVEKGRGDLAEVIVEGFIDFESEITLLTVTQKSGETLFCPPIGHRQERGDYQESWLPCAISERELHDAQEMAAKVTEALGGAGIWGVEFFLARDGVVFSELSPRPHDTGMVTLANCLSLNEFELHARAVLGLPIPSIELRRTAASAVVLADFDSPVSPEFVGIEAAMEDASVNVSVFGKPSTRVNRRMAVAVSSAPIGTGTEEVRRRATEAAACIRVQPRSTR
ncbi:MAG: phosphoribosylglycinamide formyltransferase 2 [Armatimonadetes bacterium 55-13]|nr:formate-dependent phosphoribosylglycinamide formyltransferase [Armatimonadota bacterium]OJU62483.1 MAG: phosphoribosylglycinamide formyltransferase 2 [Armatimonadetes bacterium 55-13]